MKLKTILGVVALATLTLGSCAKDYSCTCVSTYSGTSTTGTPTTIHGSKKDATTACENGSKTYAGVSVVCTLK